MNRRDGPHDASALSEALVIWTGWGDTASPSRDETRLVEAYGKDEAVRLLPGIQALERDFYESDAPHRVRDLAEIGAAAKAEFLARHPEVSEEAAEALAWCFTFDNR